MIMPGDAERETRIRSVKVSMKFPTYNKADIGCAANLEVNEIMDVYTLSWLIRVRVIFSLNCLIRVR